MPIPTTKDAETNSAADVLIVNESSDSFQVLSTILQRRGLTAIGTRTAADGLRMAHARHPRVIVLDEDLADPDGQTCREYQAAASEDDACLVVLGSIRRQDRSSLVEKIAKPYHFGALVRRIETLFEETKRAA